MKHTARTLTTCAGLLGCTFFFAGCTGTHLYREANHELATNTQASFKAANLSQTLVQERKQVDAISQRELAVVGRQTLALRDAWLIEIVGRADAQAATNDLSTQITNRLVELLGSSDTNVLTTLNTKLQLVKAKQSQKDKAAALYKILAKPADPALPPTAGTDEEIKNQLAKISRPELVAVFNPYIQRCQELQQLQADLKTFAKAGQMLQLSTDLAAIDDLKSQLSKVLADRKKAFDDAQKAYADALDSKKTNVISSAAEKLTNALAMLELDSGEDIITNLEASGFKELGLEGKLDKFEQQKAAFSGILNLLIDDTTKTNTMKTFTNQPTVLFIADFLPSLREQVGNQILHPPIQHLLLVQQHLSAEMDAAKRRVTHAQNRYQFMQEKQSFMMREIALLTTAQQNLLNVSSTLAGTDTLAAAMNKLKPDQAEKVDNALINYSLSWKIGRVGEESADYKIIAERHQAALDDSEIALAEWDNLIGVPLSQLVALHASGIKPETIAQIISAAGIAAAIGAK